MSTALPSRRIGELEVSVMGLGCMGMTLTYGLPDRAEAQATIDRAIERGVTLFDTADMYGAGAGERFLATALRGRRDRVVLASKAGIRTRFGGLPHGVDGRPQYLRQAVDASLRRLDTDWIDLFYLHRVDPAVPIEDSVGALADAASAGKIRAIGVSEVTADELRRAHGVHPISAVQAEWSVLTHDVETEVVPMARQLGVAVVAYSPLGRGLLTGSPRASTRLPLLDYRRLLPRWRRRNLAANLDLVARVRSVGAAIGATPGQVALAWLLAQGRDVVPIPGTKRPRYLDENLAAIDVHLPPEAMAELSRMRASGERYRSGTGVPDRSSRAR